MNIAEELIIVGRYATIDGSEGEPIYNTPITPRENYLRIFREGEKPMWAPVNGDIVSLLPRIIPDNVARATVTDDKPFVPERDAGGPDMFGVEWRYIPTARGSMVEPGKPVLEDIEDWKNVIRLPDVDSYDWEDASELLRPLYTSGRANMSTIYTGLFERLISFMDFDGAAVALIDDEQKPYVHEIFDALCGIYDRLMYNLKKYFELDIICVHDDWGSQRAPFFSLDVCREMLLPYLKRLVDTAHKYGMIFNFHSCGRNELLVPAMIEAGVDMWSGQNLNDWELLSEKYGGVLKYNIAMDKFDPAKSTEEEYIADFLAAWEKYSHYESCIVIPTRMRVRGLTEKCFERVYALSREKYQQG